MDSSSERSAVGERENHELTHLPYRSWCMDCVLGRGKKVPHLRQGVQERSIPEVSWNYFFMGSEASTEKVLTILVARDRDSRMICSTVVPRIGTTGDFATKRINACINEIGYEFVEVTIKSDQEPAIKALIDDIKG